MEGGYIYMFIPAKFYIRNFVRSVDNGFKYFPSRLFKGKQKEITVFNWPSSYSICV